MSTPTTLDTNDTDTSNSTPLAPESPPTTLSNPNTHAQTLIPLYCSALENSAVLYPPPPDYHDNLAPHAPRYPILPREEEGCETLPGYSTSIHREGTMRWKLELVSPYNLSSHRAWQLVYVQLNNTQLNIYCLSPTSFKALGSAARIKPRAAPDLAHQTQTQMNSKNNGTSGAGSSNSSTRPPGEYLTSSSSSQVISDGSNRLDPAVLSGQTSTSHPHGAHPQHHLQILTGALIDSSTTGPSRIGKLLRTYTLQYAEVGTAVDYTKRQHISRVRAEVEQFLLEASSPQDHISWVNSLQTGIDLALPLEERDLPKNRLIPRGRRHGHGHHRYYRSASTPAPVMSSSLQLLFSHTPPVVGSVPVPARTATPHTRATAPGRPTTTTAGAGGDSSRAPESGPKSHNKVKQQPRLLSRLVKRFRSNSAAPTNRPSIPPSTAMYTTGGGAVAANSSTATSTVLDIMPAGERRVHSQTHSRTNSSTSNTTIQSSITSITEEEEEGQEGQEVEVEEVIEGETRISRTDLSTELNIHLDMNSGSEEEQEDEEEEDYQEMLKKWEPQHPQESNLALLKYAYRCLKPLPATASWLEKPVIMKGQKYIVKRDNFLPVNSAPMIAN